MQPKCLQVDKLLKAKRKSAFQHSVVVWMKASLFIFNSAFLFTYLAVVWSVFQLDFPHF